MEEKHYTLCFCRRKSSTDTKDNEILLGMKKRGFGVGKWNGFGGKIEAGETIVDATIRELFEESALQVQPADLIKRGYLLFKMEESKKLMHVHVFESFVFVGQEQESDEMRPQWFKEDAIPFNDTWPDDKFWMPILLKGTNSFNGRFDYSNDETISDYEISEH